MFDLDRADLFLPVGVGLKYPEAQVLRSYAISVEGTSLASAPKSWTVEGSNDNGGSYTVLDEVVNYTLATSGLNEFSLANTVAYGTYRLNVSAHGGDRFLTIAEVVFRTERTNAFQVRTGDTTFTLGENLFANREYDANGFPLKRPLKMALVQQKGLPADRIVTVDFPTENQFCHPTKPGGVVALTTAVSNIVHPIYTRTNFDSISSIRVRVLKADGTLDTDLIEPYFMVLHFV